MKKGLLSCNKYVKIIGTLIVLSLSAIVVYVILSNVNVNKSPDYEEGFYGDRLGDYRVYYKDQWGGRPPNAIVPLIHPTRFVIISHSASPSCDSFRSCSELVKIFQDHHFTRGNNDIGYNFLIGGDAGVYVGRGWDVRNFHNNVSIGISFIGDYNFDVLSSEMIEVAKLLIQQGLDLKKLSDQYILIGHNQSSSSLPYSPGVNVYKEIKNWPHFSNKTYF